MPRSAGPPPHPPSRRPPGSDAPPDADRDKEVAALIQAGDLHRAALLVRSLGNPRYAARLFLDARLPYQAAVCFYEAGDKKESLGAFIQVPRTDERYRRAAVQVIRLSAELGAVTQSADRFLGPFLAAPPRSDEELLAAYKLGVLYQSGELFDHALEAFGVVLAASPGYADVAQRVATIGPLLRNPDLYRRLLRQDASEWRSPPRPPPPPAAANPSQAPPRRVASSPPSTSGASRKADVDPRALRSSSPPASGESPAGGASHEARHATHSGLRAPPDLAAGAVIDDRYRIEEELGRGGMGVVYRATDLELGEAVALKVFAQREDDRDLLQRFKQELSICRSLAHPNVIRLHDIGAHEGRKFISMELLSGASMRAFVKERLGVKAAVRLLEQACAGVGAAHARGVVHRDVKSDNLFVTTEGIVKLMDFGLAKRLASLDEEGGATEVTVAGFIGGSPAYMAPEQITDFAHAGFGADIYSLGIVAYELFAGTRPFRSKERARMFKVHLTEAPRAPSTVDPRLPAEVDRVVLRCLEKDPADRYASCDDLRDALLSLVRRLP